MTETNKRLKVCVIHPECGVSWNGGSQINAYEVAEHLASHYDVELLCGKEVGTVSVVLPGVSRGRSANWLATTYLGGLFRKAFGYPGMVIEAITCFFPYLFHVLKSKPDIIYPNNDYGGLAIAWLVRAIRGTKVLYTEHAGMLSDGVVLKRNMKFRPDYLIVFNDDTQKIVEKWYPEQAVAVIPNGVDLTRFSSNGDKFEFQLQGKIVLCVGTLNRKNHKRIELAIRAMALVPQASLVLCGDGVDKDYFVALGKELLGDSRFKQMSLAFDEMPKLYRSVDVFTLPSGNEPFGRVYLEALASGTPVVAPDDAMRNIIVGEAGILCDVEVPEYYAAALKQSLEMDWKTLPLEQANKFGWESVALQYKGVIDCMIKSRN